MKYYVVSDIHGFYKEMIESLKEKGFFDDKEPHKLIICGDLLDRGKEIDELVKFVLDLMKNDEVLKTCSVTTKSGEVANVDLVLEDAVNISTSDSYSIVVSQASDTNFVFDTVLFFIDSEE